MASNRGEEPSSEPAAVADRVRELRGDLGMNQTEFARALGTSRSYVSDLENRNAKVSVDILFDIVERFKGASKKATIYWLLTGSSDPVPWGPDPAGNSLNTILALNTRARVTAIASVDVLDRALKVPMAPESKADLLRHLLYVYHSELERARQAGSEATEAHRIARAACDTVVRSFELSPVGDG